MTGPPFNTPERSIPCTDDRGCVARRRLSASKHPSLHAFEKSFRGSRGAVHLAQARWAPQVAPQDPTVCVAGADSRSPAGRPTVIVLEGRTGHGTRGCMKPAAYRATYEDRLEVPENMVAEIIDGELYATPRPASPHANAASGAAGGFCSSPSTPLCSRAWNPVY